MCWQPREALERRYGQSINLQVRAIYLSLKVFFRENPRILKTKSHPKLQMKVGGWGIFICTSKTMQPSIFEFYVWSFLKIEPFIILFIKNHKLLINIIRMLCESPTQNNAYFYNWSKMVYCLPKFPKIISKIRPIYAFKHNVNECQTI